MKTFESKSTDKAFPWRVFNTVFVMCAITLNFYGWLAEVEILFYAMANLGSLIIAILLGKFIQYLKIVGTIPPVKISENGICITSGIGFGESIVSWNQIHKISTVMWTDTQRRKSYPAIEVEVVDAGSVVQKTTGFKKALVGLFIRLGGGKKYLIIEEQIKDGLDELIMEIEKYYPVNREI